MRPVVGLSLLIVVLVFTSIPAFAGVQLRMADDAFAPLERGVAPGGRVQLRNFRLPSGEKQTLELERFEIWAPNAVIEIKGANDHVIERLPIPKTKFFRGTIAGEPDSIVYLSIDQQKIFGRVIRNDRHYVIRSGGKAGRELMISDAEPIDLMATKPFECGAREPNFENVKALRMAPSAFQPVGNNALASATANYIINLAVETDYEIFAFAGSTGTLNTFLDNLFAQMAVIYRRDLDTDVLQAYRGIHTNIADPFNVVPGMTGNWTYNVAGAGTPGGMGAPTTQSITYDTFHALLEFCDRWQNTPPSANVRSAAALISGKASGGGVAWTNTLGRAASLCNNNCGDEHANGHYFGPYSYSGDIGNDPGELTVPDVNANPNFISNNAANTWPLMEVTHELGHNVHSPHTHCIRMYAADQATYLRTYADNCVASAGSTTCYAGAAPGLPAEAPQKGTIMSYCHFPGTYGDLRWTFGQPTDGSRIVKDRMNLKFTNLNTVALVVEPLDTSKNVNITGVGPGLSEITAPVSVTAGVAAAASVTATAPQSATIASYKWTITNGTINGADNAASVNFTGTTSPVTLRVTVTTSFGIGATDTKTITVTGGACTTNTSASNLTYNASAVTGLSFGVSSTCAWTATSSQPFVALTTAAAGGDGPVVFNISQNNTGNARVATVTVTSTAGSRVVTFTQSANTVTPGDANLDGLGDLIWRNGTSGTNVMWLMNASGIHGSAILPQVADTNFKIAGIGDFQGDGKADLLWRNLSTGTNVIWLMDGTTVAASAVLTNVPAPWDIAGIGDFQGDGKADIVWRNTVSGNNSIWFMDGMTLASSQPLPAVADVTWTIAGIGDFQNDNKADILWRNTSTGSNSVWLMNGATVAVSATLPLVADTNFKIVGIGDFQGDGKDDVMWRNSVSGANVLWYMDGAGVGLGIALTPVADTNWKVARIADFQGDGKADVMWRNSVSGSNSQWLMNGGVIAAGNPLPLVADAAWTVATTR